MRFRSLKMTPATTQSNLVQQFARIISCPHCLSSVEAQAKFCGNCGSVNRYPVSQAVQSAQPAHRAQPQSAQRPEQPVQAKAQSVPKFAQPLTGKRAPVPPQLRDELTLLMTTLLRERIFLLAHCCFFLMANLFGFSLSFQAYTGFVGDEMTKLVISLTPLMFINSLGLLCLVPIKGTKREIARVKEKIQYARFRIEYHNQF